LATFMIRCCDARPPTAIATAGEEARPSIRLFGLLRALPAVLCGGIGPPLRKH
jgi:hypothetical protein